MRFFAKFESIIGDLYLVANDEVLLTIYFGEADLNKHEDIDNLFYQEDHRILSECRRQLSEYFAGKRSHFNLSLELKGTPFQQAVWNQLNMIPYGDTKSYSEIAALIGREKAVRAVGQANKANRYPIIIPCHRVIGKNDQLTGYAGTRVELKKILLEHEAKHKSIFVIQA